MGDLTPEERAEWRRNAEPRGLYSDEAGCLSGRILRLLDALDAAEAEAARPARERLAALPVMDTPLHHEERQRDWDVLTRASNGEPCDPEALAALVMRLAEVPRG